MWFELVNVRDLADLARQIGRRVGSDLCNLVTVCNEATAKLPLDKAGFERWYDATYDREPLKDAVRRLDVPTDGAVYLVMRSDSDEGQVVRLLMRDLVAFEDVIWWCDAYAVDENGRWILEGVHVHLARWLDLRNAIPS